MNSRKFLAAELRKKLPRQFKIIPEPRTMDELEARRPVVMLIRTNIKPAGTANYLADFAIWVIEPKLIDPEDALDDALDAVVLALDGLEFLLWTDAERSTYRDHPAWRISAQVVAIKKE